MFFFIRVNKGQFLIVLVSDGTIRIPCLSIRASFDGRIRIPCFSQIGSGSASLVTLMPGSGLMGVIGLFSQCYGEVAATATALVKLPYWGTQMLPLIYTANQATFPIQIRKTTVQIYGNLWVTQYHGTLNVFLSAGCFGIPSY